MNPRTADLSRRLFYALSSVYFTVGLANLRLNELKPWHKQTLGNLDPAVVAVMVGYYHQAGWYWLAMGLAICILARPASENRFYAVLTTLVLLLVPWGSSWWRTWQLTGDGLLIFPALALVLGLSAVTLRARTG